ncbi:MAG: Nif3-like dinuclear metal center hexameric protein [Bacteroidota bacterium]|nr:Nif3-like dinuclear metal center hexameric protein [Bacteroidota bacterium]
MIISDLLDSLNEWAPPSFQEDYDNSGMICGDPTQPVKKVLIALDCIESVVDEAIREKANVIIAHHPIVFKGLRSFTGKNYVERTVIKAIRNHIAIIAVHTNLDNVRTGVNHRIAEKLKLKDIRILDPKMGILQKLVVFVPRTHTQQLMNSLFEAGAGGIGNYDECSFRTAGTGTFRGNENANPYLGKKGERSSAEEDRVEVIFEKHRLSKVLSAMNDAHPYEEIAYDLLALENAHDQVGSGMIGDLDQPMETMEFLGRVKKTFSTGCVRYTRPHIPKVKKVAICGGSGSFLLEKAIRQKADILITADFKYHQFFDAEDRIVIADIGHYESEQFTIDLIADRIREKFPNFAVLKTQVNTNPIQYL